MRMLMAIGILTTGVTLVMLGCFVWQLRRLTRQLMTALGHEQHSPVLYQDLSQQVNQLHQAMGGVVNSLRVVGHQVHHLNRMAGHIVEQGEALEQPAAQIVIEVHGPHGEATHEGTALLRPEDMPPEVYERFRTFQSVYGQLLSQPHWPSSQNPDEN